MGNYEILREKAVQVCEQCKASGLPQPQFSVVSDYTVNLKWHDEEADHTLSIAYSPKRQRWTLSPNTDWLKTVVCPLIQPLFDQELQQPSSLPKQSASPSQEPDPQRYFVKARESLQILEPFASANVDCSIICELTREAVQMVLCDPAFAFLDRSALMAAVNSSNTADFFAAKEFFTKCLNMCTRNSNGTNS